jgi:cell division ATPase FtsA
LLSYTTATAGLFPAALVIEAVAIARSLLPLEEAQTTSATIIIDIGAARTGLIVFDQGTIQFTVSLPISGHKITATIATSLKLDEAEAEQAKILCGLDPKKCHGSMATIPSRSWTSYPPHP